MSVDFTSTTAVIGTGVGFGGAVLALCWKSEDVASPAAKTAIANWLRRLDVGETLERWPDGFVHLFDQVFGERHFSISCFLRSCVASIVAVVILVFVFLSLRGVDAIYAGLFGDMSLWETIEIFLIFALGVNLLADYLSLLETRYLLNMLPGRRGLLTTPIFLLVDAILTLAIYFGVILISLTLADSLLMDGESLKLLFRDPREWLDQFLTVMIELFTFEGFIGKYGTCLYSSFFTSLWLWLFVISRWLVRLITPLRAWLRLGKWFLDIDSHPLRSLGVVAGGLASLGYWLVIGLARAAEAAAS